MKKGASRAPFFVRHNGSEGDAESRAHIAGGRGIARVRVMAREARVVGHFQGEAGPGVPAEGVAEADLTPMRLLFTEV